jgi:hypothetical protein
MADSTRGGPRFTTPDRVAATVDIAALTPQERAEIIDPVEYDEAQAALANCADYDPEVND